MTLKAATQLLKDVVKCGWSNNFATELYILQKLNGYFNLSMVSSVAALLPCLQMQSTYCVCICHQRRYWFCFMDYSIV